MTKAKAVLFLHDFQTQLRIQNFFENSSHTDAQNLAEIRKCYTKSGITTEKNMALGKVKGYVGKE